MASVSSVFSIDFEGKRTLSLINITDTFIDISKKFLMTDGDSGLVSCSTNGCEWTSITMDIMRLPVIQVMQLFCFKYIKIDKKPD